MPPQKRAPCQVCQANESKYTCSKCMIVYCSVPCYKQHKEDSCSSEGPSNAPPAGQSLEPGKVSSNLSETPELPSSQQTDTPQGSTNSTGADPALPPPSLPLRPLTTLNWPYVPEQSAYPDPLKRDDPKPLQLHQYEAIATSPAVRTAFASHPQLPGILRSIDALRGEEREEALQRALGVSAANLEAAARPGMSQTVQGRPEEDIRALRELAEAIEASVRGGKEDALGLDWGD